jgi:tetraacyldisaccharide 4'-kinase
MQRWLEHIWYGSGSGWYLRPLTPVYGALERARAAAYRLRAARAVRVGRPVIVVGNVTVGGTGKTPLVAWLADALAARGMRVGIVSRGYGRAGGALHMVETDTTWRQVGDEPLLLARRTRAMVAVARNRVAAARQLVGLGADVIVADDGLQHLRLARECEIAVIDGARGFGNGRLLPSGPLREPLERLDRVSAIVLNGGSGSGGAFLAGDPAVPVFTMAIVPESVVRIDVRGPAEPLASYRGRTVHAVAGIGNPRRFFAMLREHGVLPIEHPFPDHHAFRPEDVEFGDALPVLMTEKDAVKCAYFAEPRLRCVRVNARFDEPDTRRLIELVLRRLDVS